MLGDILNNSCAAIVFFSLSLIASAFAYGQSRWNSKSIRIMAFIGILSCSFGIGVIIAAGLRKHPCLLSVLLASLAFTLLCLFAIIPLAGKAIRKIIALFKSRKEKHREDREDSD